MPINKSIPTNHIRLIRDHLSNFVHPVIFESVSSIKEWEDSGCPYVIELVEQYDNAYCYLDSGYGCIFLIVENGEMNDKIVGGEDICMVDNIIALNKNAYGTESYIFKGNANHE